jgi:DNA helicase-2/ATP-dependent DNA helicase PcrA
MAFGSAVHYALELRNKALANKEKYTASMFLTTFEDALKGELLTKEEFDKRLEYGRIVLKNYFKTYLDEEAHPIFIERFFGRGLRKAVYHDIPLVGRIDRIDLIDPKEKTVRVIDYKTGRAKTVGEIEGKTVSVQLSERELGLPESIRGPYKRQLLFYKLLTDLDVTFQYTVSEGMFDFVEPNKETGKFTRRTFTIVDSDINDLKTLIVEVMKEIRELKFLELK